MCLVMGVVVMLVNHAFGANAKGDMTHTGLAECSDGHARAECSDEVVKREDELHAGYLYGHLCKIGGRGLRANG